MPGPNHNTYLLFLLLEPGIKRGVINVFCRQCGNRLLQDALFCNQCGTKVANEDDATQRMPPQGRITIQFGNNPSSPQFPPTQFGSSLSSQQLQPGQSGSSPGNPGFPPTQFGAGSQQLPPTQFGRGPSNPQLPLMQFGSTSQQLPPAQFGSNPQFPPTQFAGNSRHQPQQFELQPGQFGSNPSNPQLPPTQFAGSSQLPPTQFANGSPLVLPPWQTQGWSQTSTTSAPSQPVVAIPPSPSATQRLLINIFQPALASNALLGILLGGIVAAVLGCLASVLIVVIAHAIAPHPSTGYPFSGEDSVNYALGIFSLYSPWRDGLQLFLVAHGVGLHLVFSSTFSNNTNTFSYAYNPALNGLLIIPALLLTLGGYLAASTDFQNRPQTSLLRGAAIAIPYTVLLFILASQANGCIPISDFSHSGSIPTCTGTSEMGTLTIDNLSLIVLGILWGGLFGLLGASLKLARGQWRQMMLSYLRTGPRSQLKGMITGGLAASGLGLSLSLLVLFCLLAYAEVSVPLFTRSFCQRGDWQILTLWGIAQGPLHAVNLFFLSFGTPITISNPTPQQFPCFYATGQPLTLSLFDGNSSLPAWRYVLLAVPVISLFLGGRVSAAIGRVQGTGPGAIQGLIITAPFTVLMALLSFFCTVTVTFANQANSGGSVSSSQPSAIHVQSAGVGLANLLLWALLSGSVLGALGGAYQASGTRLPSILSGLLRGLSAPIYGILNLVSRQHRSVQRTAARNLLYSAVFCAFLLAIIAGAAGGYLIAFNDTLSLADNQHIRDIISVVLVALPGLLLVSSCASALSHVPSLNSQTNMPTGQFLRGGNQ